MQLPNIIVASELFVNEILPKLNQTPSNSTADLLVAVNRMWTNTPLNRRANIPRVPGWINDYPTHVVRQLKLSTTNKTLEELSQARAVELLSTNRPIKFFWSGGIDSTLALTYLLINLTTPDQITVMHTCESEDENPRYVDYIKSFGVELVSWSDSWAIPFAKDDLVVTGTTCDQLTASVDESFYHDHLTWLNRPWPEYFEFRGAGPELIARCQLLFGDLTTTLEARWWFYFYIRHQFWTVKDWNLNLENGPGKNVVCFFDTAEFDAWSYTNRNRLFLDDTWKEYKGEFKQAIYQHWPDLDYRLNKTKQSSGYATMWSRKKMVKFDQQYLFMYQDRDGVAQLFQPRYWPLLNLDLILEDLDAI